MTTTKTIFTGLKETIAKRMNMSNNYVEETNIRGMVPELFELDNPVKTPNSIVKEPTEASLETLKIEKTKGDITLTEEQYQAVAKIVHWFKNTKKPTFELAGYAGTGKSTVVDFVLSNLKIRNKSVHMCAPTGTASLVLKSKTPDYTSSTLHRAIYTLEEEKLGVPKFVPNYDGLKDIKLLIVDEASMIGTKMGDDLLDVARLSGTRVLIIGDPEQLPPVSDNGQRAFLDNPDYTLTKVMRQAEDNKIIDTSMKIRNNQWIQPFENLKFGDELMVFNRAKIDTEKLYGAFAKCINNGGAVIVGKNNTRKSITSSIRRIFGFNTPELMNGERIVIKQNFDLTDSGLLYSGCIDMLTNGMVGIVSDVKDRGYYYTFTFTSDKFDLTVKGLSLRKDILNEEISYMGSGEKCLPTILRNAKYKKGVEEVAGINAVFGYVLTCHNSQGSQWDTVYVLDESPVFKEDASRWLYTAVTRAAKRLVIIKSFDRYFKEENVASNFTPTNIQSISVPKVTVPTPVQTKEENIVAEENNQEMIVYPSGHCVPTELVNLMNKEHCQYYYKDVEVTALAFNHLFIKHGFNPICSDTRVSIYKKENTFIIVSTEMDLETSYWDKACYGLRFTVNIQQTN